VRQALPQNFVVLLLLFERVSLKQSKIWRQSFLTFVSPQKSHWWIPN